MRKKETARFNTNGKNRRHSTAALLLLITGTKHHHQLQVRMIVLAMREPTEKIPRAEGYLLKHRQPLSVDSNNVLYPACVRASTALPLHFQVSAGAVYCLDPL